MKKVEFKNLKYRAQVRLLKELAYKTSLQFPIKVQKIDFIQHGENTTFKVTDSKNKNYLLRIHRDGYHTPKGIKEELSWLDRLARQTDIIAPRPIKTKTGKWIANEEINISGEKRNITLFKWVEGRQIKKSINASHLKKTAELTFKLHQNTRKTKVKYRNYWNAQGLVGSKPFVGPMNKIAGLTKKEQEILNIARKIVYSNLARYERANPKRMGLIHADLHFGNFFYHKGVICPIDFDDCGYGFHMYDLAVTLISLSYGIDQKIITKKQYELLSDKFLESYSFFSHLSATDLKTIRFLKLARHFFGVQWLNKRDDNPKLKERATPYAKETVIIGL